MKLRDLLVKHGVVNHQAVNDAEGFDGSDTLTAIILCEEDLEAEAKSLRLLLEDRDKALTMQLNENRELRDKLDRYSVEHPTICYQCGRESEDPKTVQELRERLQKAESACAEKDRLLASAQRMWATGRVWSIEADELNHALSSDCGKRILDRMKSMEEILDALPHSGRLGHFQDGKQVCDRYCPACLWETMRA